VIQTEYAEITHKTHNKQVILKTKKFKANSKKYNLAKGMKTLKKCLKSIFRNYDCNSQLL
jgi:hypothetical protein